MEPDRPLIQIDDLVRPMTDDEYTAYQEAVQNAPIIPEPE
jgi:hypothetical protein